MISISMKQLLEAGVHFGHHSRKWNPKMNRYIYTERNNIYIIDLKKTLRMLRDAYKFVRDTVAAGGTILFVGTKKQAKDSVREAAESCNMYYVTNRWMGGMLTNFQTVSQSVARLKQLDKEFEDGSIQRLSKKMQAASQRERERLERNLGGIKNMDTLPTAVFVIDPDNEDIAVAEANKLRIPVVGVVDTSCDPDPVDIVIPGNDDAIRAIKLFSQKISEAVLEGLMARVEAGELIDLPPAAEALRQSEAAQAEAYSALAEDSVSMGDEKPAVAAAPAAAAPAPAAEAPAEEAKAEEAPAAEAAPAEKPEPVAVTPAAEEVPATEEKPADA
jgi:small subunit ribosomal protein S2